MFLSRDFRQVRSAATHVVRLYDDTHKNNNKNDILQLANISAYIYNMGSPFWSYCERWR